MSTTATNPTAATTAAPAATNAATTSATPATTTSADITAKVIGARCIEFQLDGEDFQRHTLELKLDKEFKRMTKDKDNGEWKEITTKVITLPFAKGLELAQSDEVAAFFISMVEDVTSKKSVACIFTGATVTLSNVFHTKGEIIDGDTLDRDKWFADLTSYKPGALNLRKMNEAIDAL